MSQISQNTFSRCLNQLFTMTDGSGTARELELVEIAPRGQQGAAEPIGEEVYSFSLLFRAGVGSGLNQGLYEFRHPALETMSIFIVPVGADTEGEYYEAVFN
jgi:hypothetical protein